MKKKVFIALLALIVGVFAMTGCVGQTSGSSERQPQTSTSASVSDERIKVEINVVNSLPDAQDASELTPGGESGENSPEPIADSFKAVLQYIRKTVLEFYITAGSEKISASGVLIASTKQFDEERSYFVTCHHLVADALAITTDLSFSVKTVDGEEYQATFIGSDPDSDVSVFSVPAALPCATLYVGDNDVFSVGDAVLAVGNQGGVFGGSVTMGMISAEKREIFVSGKPTTFLQTDAVVNQGCSGGGLFTTSGYLIGVLNASVNDMYEGLSGIGFALTCDTVTSVSADIMETYTGERYGYVAGKYNLGFKVANYYPGLFMPNAYVYIEQLDQTGCFYKAGVMLNDIIESVEYNGVRTSAVDAGEFTEYLNSIDFKIGDRLVLRIMRGDVPYTITVTVQQYIFGMN